jgi:hypothetical protein
MAGLAFLVSFLVQISRARAAKLLRSVARWHLDPAATLSLCAFTGAVPRSWVAFFDGHRDNAQQSLLRRPVRSGTQTCQIDHLGPMRAVEAVEAAGTAAMPEVKGTSHLDSGCGILKDRSAR